MLRLLLNIPYQMCNKIICNDITMLFLHKKKYNRKEGSNLLILTPNLKNLISFRHFSNQQKFDRLSTDSTLCTNAAISTFVLHNDCKWLWMSKSRLWHIEKSLILTDVSNRPNLVFYILNVIYAIPESESQVYILIT